MEAVMIPDPLEDWKLNPNVECRIILNKLKIKTPEYETMEFCRTLTNTTKDMGFDFKSEFILDVLLNDILRKCDEKCELCEEYVHQLRHHINQAHSTSSDGQTVFKCDICSSIYSSPSMLIRHRNTHSNSNQSDTLIAPCSNEPEPVRFDSNNIYASFDISSVTTRNEIVSSGQYENNPQQLVPVPPMNFEWNCVKQESSSSQSQMEVSNPNLPGILQHMNHLSTIENNLKQESDDLECQEDLHDPLLVQDIDLQQVPSFVKSECTGMFTESEQQTVFMTHEKRSIDTPTGEKSLLVPSDLIRHKMTHTGQKSHKCVICGKCFGRSHHLTEHKLIHTGRKPHKCGVCGRCFTLSRHLAQHRLTHTGEKSFRCDECGRGFARGSCLVSHKLTHTGERPHKCDVCGQGFNRRSQLTQHKLKHTGEKNNEEFSSSNSLGEISNPYPPGILQHMNNLSTIENDLKQESEDLECEEDLHDPLLLQDIDFQVLQVPSFVKSECTEMSTHSEQQIVLVMSSNVTHADAGEEQGRQGVLFSSDVVTHKITQSNQKSHKCDVCGKCFVKQCNLTQHTLTHTAEKPYKCDVCQRSFSQKSHLKRHKLTHTGEKPFCCDVCGRRFTLGSNLANHKVTHTGERPHECDVCGKDFAQRSALIRHNMTHTGEKSFGCDVCGRRFTFETYLATHKLTHTEERPHKCDVCGHGFNRRSQLTQHKLKHHSLSTINTTPTFVNHLKEERESEEEGCQEDPLLNL